MMKKSIKMYDYPSAMILDNAQEFTAKAIETLYASHGIRKLEVAPYHPKSNGLVERVNSKILKIYCEEHDTDNSIHTATVMPAALLCFTRKAFLQVGLLVPL